MLGLRHGVLELELDTEKVGTPSLLGEDDLHSHACASVGSFLLKQGTTLAPPTIARTVG